MRVYASGVAGFIYSIAVEVGGQIRGGDVTACHERARRGVWEDIEWSSLHETD